MRLVSLKLFLIYSSNTSPLREVKVRSYEYSKDSENGYVIDVDKIRFKKPDRLYVCDTCQRVYSTVPDESCAAWNCHGQLKAIAPEEYISNSWKLLHFFL